MGFFDGGAKVLSFGEVGSAEAQRVFGQWRGGVIVNIGEARQATDINDRRPRTWDNGDPVMQIPITLDTSRGRCPEPAESADDDLVRDLYITKGKQIYQAARGALRKANAKDFEVGGSLYVRWASGVGKRGDARQFEMYYEAPVGSTGGFMDDPAPGQPAAAMPPQVPPGAGGPPANHPSEVYANAGGPPAQGYPAGPAPSQPPAPPQPVWNAATQQWEIPAPEPAAPPAAPPPPPQPVWDAQANAWVIPGSAPAPAAAPPAQPSAPPSNGWAPSTQPGPVGPPPQAGNQPAANPFARR